MEKPTIAQIPRRFAIAWIAVSLIAIFMTFFGIGADAIWYDESYSLAAAKHNAGEIISMIGEDSHPPLYYLMLRGTTMLLGNSIPAARSLSALGILALVSLGFFPLRKMWGESGGLAFSIVVLCTPMSIITAHEARMYSWLAFFVTAAVIWGYRALAEKKIAYWVTAAALSLAAAYTHYFGLMAMAFFWLILIVYSIIVRDRKNIVAACVCGAVQIILYLPWIYFLALQISRVTKSFWIPPVTAGSLAEILVYPFLQKFSVQANFPALFLFAAVLVTALVGIGRGFSKKRPDNLIAALGMAVYVLTLIAAVSISFLVKPVLADRYMLSCAGLLILGFVSFLNGLEKPRIAFAAVAIFAVLNTPTMLKIYSVKVNGPMDLVAADLKNKVGTDDIFIHGSEHNFGTFSYYFPDNQHFLYVPDGFIPNGNYGIFSPNGSYGSDYGQFNDLPVKLWITNRVAEQYSLSPGLVSDSAHRKAVGKQLRYTKTPGWYTVLVQEVDYDPEKSSSTVTVVESGNLKVKITGINPKLGGMINFALYDRDPINPTTFINGGSVEIKDTTVIADFGEMPYGYYVIVAFHDINGNRLPDMKNDKFTEGFTMGEDPSSKDEGTTFEDLKFEFGPDTPAKEIKMDYPE